MNIIGQNSVISLSRQMGEGGVKSHLRKASKEMLKNAEGNTHPKGSARKPFLHIAQFSDEKINE